MHPAYILSGGQSRRFGSDKSRYQTQRGPQLLQLAQQLRDAGHAVHVVADNADRYQDLGVTCLVDTHPGCGPLAGLNAALIHHAQALAQSNHSTELAADDGWLLLVNCDQMQWHSAWYDQLLAATSPTLQAVAYYDTRWQPLPALYQINLRAVLTSRLDADNLSFHALLDRLYRESQAQKILTTQPPSQWSFNTPDIAEKIS